MITWKEFNEKMNNRFGVIFKKADDLYFNVASEINIGENIEIEDIQALKYLQNLFPMRGNLYIITDLCYCKDNGPHVVNSGLLPFPPLAQLCQKSGAPEAAERLIRELAVQIVEEHGRGLRHSPAFIYPGRHNI